MEKESSNSLGGTIISQRFKILLKIESAVWYWLSVWLKMSWRNTLHCTKRTQNKTKIIQWRLLKGFLASFHLWDYKFLHKRIFCLILFCVFKLKYSTGKSLIIPLYLFLFFRMYFFILLCIVSFLSFILFYFRPFSFLSFFWMSFKSEVKCVPYPYSNLATWFVHSSGNGYKASPNIDLLSTHLLSTPKQCHLIVLHVHILCLHLPN